MLKLRILTGAILIPLVVLGIFLLPPGVFIALTTLVIALAAWEWAGVSGLTTVVQRSLYTLLILLLMVIFQRFAIFFLVLSSFWWLYCIYLLYTYERGALVPTLVSSSCGRAVLGCVLLVACWLGLNATQFSAHGPAWLLWMLCLVWGSDIGAYFAGRAFGKHKLAERISPNKTREGFYGALLAGCVITVIGILVLPNASHHYLGMLVLGLLSVLFSVVGDLFESLLKRIQGIKDSGRLVPGHGGVLDRIDSLIAVAPVFTICSLLLRLSQ